MSAFDYARYDCPYPIRPDIPETYRQIWSEIAKPGARWTGTERVAIADASRSASRCRFCAERKQAISPYALDGEHDHAGQLPDVVVDAVHRIVTDQARLSRDWVEKLAAAGISDAKYVELLGIVVVVLSIDEFHRILDLPLEPLPAPRPGEPSGYRPTGLDAQVAWVPVLDPTKIGPRERDLFHTGRVSNVARALSLVPDALRMVKALMKAQYIPFELVAAPLNNGGRALERSQMELVAGRLSALNECFY